MHGVGDAACHGKPLLVPGTTWTTRLPANAALFDVAPPPAGKRGRPALKGARLGKLAALAAGAVWEKTTVYRYGRTETVYLARLRCIWYGSFGNAAGWCVLVRELGSARPCDLALFTFDEAATAAQAVERYAVRWPVEPANAVGKQQMGRAGTQPGEECGRADRAVRHADPVDGHRLVHPVRSSP